MEAHVTAENAQTIAATKRGIAFPSINLETAVKRAEQFWNAERKNAAPADVAVTHWGYSLKSSGGKLTTAALISYGLLRDEGSKEERTVRLTERALDIVLHPIDAPERLQALKAAARAPKINNELLAKWPPNSLPSDQTIKVYLLREKDFNPNTVDSFIKDFRATVRYAKLD